MLNGKGSGGAPASTDSSVIGIAMFNPQRVRRENSV
jgi:hypothetical protein